MEQYNQILSSYISLLYRLLNRTDNSCFCIKGIYDDHLWGLYDTLPIHDKDFYRNLVELTRELTPFLLKEEFDGFATRLWIRLK